MIGDSITSDLLDQVKPSDIYVHYFDVNLEKTPGRLQEVYPMYVLTDVDSAYRKYTIVPVIYIVNDVLKDANIETLAKNITKLVSQISQHQFQVKPNEIQLDCDWTLTTRDAFFALVKALQKNFRVSCTIRLHQIKYYEKTGVPPVNKGVLMLYNMSDLKDEKQNSILSLKTVEEYINKNTSYPLPLDVALPAFSQTVIFKPDGGIKLINSDQKSVLQNSRCFKRLDNNLYEALRDTLFEGFFLSKGTHLKTELPDAQEIIQSYQFLKESNLNLTEKVVLYHLDNSPETVEYLKNIISGL